MDTAVAARRRRPSPGSSAGTSPSRWTRTSSSSSRASCRCCAKRKAPRPAVPGRAVPDAGLDAGRQLPQQHRLRARECGSRCTRSRDATASAISSASTTTRHTRSSWARTPARCSSTSKDAGYGFLIAGMHVKGQVIDSKGVSGWGYGGQTVQRGDWVDGEVSANPADLANAWKKQTVLCEHELPGTARHDPLAYLQNRTVDWLDHQLAARELLDFDPDDDAAHRRARVRRGAGAGPGQARADPGRFDGVHPPHRRGGGRDVRAAARGAGIPGHPGPGRRAPGIPFMKRSLARCWRSPATQAGAPAPLAGARGAYQLDRRDARWRSLAWAG